MMLIIINKDLNLMRGQKEHLENILSMKSVDVRKNLANEIVKVDNSLSRSIKSQVAENDLLLGQLKELQGEKDTITQTLSIVMQKIESLESKVGDDE